LFIGLVNLGLFVKTRISGLGLGFHAWRGGAIGTASLLRFIQ